MNFNPSLDQRPDRIAHWRRVAFNRAFKLQTLAHRHDGHAVPAQIAAERLDSIFLGSERAYLFSTAIRVAQGLARKSRRDELRADPEDGEDVRPPQSHDSLSRRHAATAFIEQLFARMDPTLVTVFVLYELEGFSAPEIATVLGIPVGTVASRLRRVSEDKSSPG